MGEPVASIIEAVTKTNGKGSGAQGFALAVLVLVGVYYIVQSVAPGLALTDKSYLDRTAVAFDKLANSLDTQTLVLKQIAESSHKTTESVELLSKRLIVAPSDVLTKLQKLEGWMEDGKYTEELLEAVRRIEQKVDKDVVR